MLRMFRSANNSSPTVSTPTPPMAPSGSSASMAAGPARPLRLVYCDTQGKFLMDPEAVAALQLVKGPIGVVSVCGRARQGKSFILNQLLGRSNGFQVASTHKPCTKGLWMWSAPLKQTAIDGTEYNLVLLDSEGIDAYDQTGTYSTQIFSLALLLSSMFIYNQMGGIDEAALDRLSLVTEMTKHIRVRASTGKTSITELGQFSPIFVWLLRDFYLDLVEDGRRISPRDYLEVALRPMRGGGREVIAKNEIRDSIRALFPDRECFTLVRPLNDESALQRLDQIQLEKLRPEFRAGLDALTKFVFERTRPKQVGSTIMTGPVFIGITQSFLDAINKGAVPAIASSWQSVEEAECRRAYESAAEVYMSNFDRSKPPDEVLDGLISEYEVSFHGPGKWKKLAQFLQQCLEGPIFDLVKKELDQAASEKNDLMLKFRSNEDKLKLLSKQVEANEQHRADYLRRYEEALSDKRKIAEDYLSRINNLQSKYSSLEERYSNLAKTLDATSLESVEWKRKYEQISSRHKAEEEQVNAEIATLKSKARTAEARLAAAREQMQAAQEEASEWKRKFDMAVKESKSALEKAAQLQDRSNHQIQLRENSLKAEYAAALAKKEEQIKEKETKLEQAEHRVMCLSSELKIVESSFKSKDAEYTALKVQVEELGQMLDSAKVAAQSFEREARMLQQEKDHLEEKYLTGFRRFEEAEDRYKTAEKEARRAAEFIENARNEAASAEKEKNEVHRLAMERLALIERAERQIETLERQKADLVEDVEQLRASEMAAISKVSALETRVQEREKEIKELVESANQQRATTVEVLEGLLATERAAHEEAECRAKALSLQLQATQGKLDAVHRELTLTSVRLNETPLDGKFKTSSHAKRSRVEDYAGVESVHDMEVDADIVRTNKRPKSTTSPTNNHADDGGSVFKPSENDSQQDTEDYTKFTAQKLKQELTKHGFGAELLQLRNPNKRDILTLYEKHVLNS
ncbi:unnamed protein product [Victoria cruziana]